MALLEHAVREDLNRRAPRVMGVLDPLKVVIENYPEGQVEEFEVADNPEDPSAGTRRVPFSRELYIERDDFREDPPKKFFRLSPGREVRLRGAYFVTCTSVVKDPATGEIAELRCTYDPGHARRGRARWRKVKATLHWVSARTHSTSKYGSTIGSSTPKIQPRSRTTGRGSIPDRSRSEGEKSSRAWPA